MNYLLDTHHATALWRGHPALVAKVAGASDAKVHVCMPTVGELWYRVFDSAKASENEAALRAFLDRYPPLEFDATAVREFGLIKVALHKISRPIPEVDAQIAAVARARDMIVLTADQHFSVVSGLKVENWLASANPSKPG
jgi:tRNA(fMet)-specific endonuclease VapC